MTSSTAKGMQAAPLSSANLCPLIFDNIGLSLQQAGGLSTMWTKIINRVSRDGRFKAYCINRPEIQNNKFFADIAEAPYQLLETPQRPLRVDEMLFPRIEFPAVFHSSYFRCGRGTGVVNVTTVHDFICMYYYTGFTRSFSIKQIKRAVLHSDAIICISEHTKADLLKFIPEAAKLPIRIVPNAYDAQSFVAHPDEPLHNRAAFVGARGVSYKNFALAAQSVALVPDMELLVIGSALNDDERAFLDDVLPGRYANAVYPSAAEMSTLLSGSQALLYLSEYEGFGIPLLEGMASGVPVIALNKSVMPEVTGDAAFLLDDNSPAAVANALHTLQSDATARKDLIARGFNRAAQYSWDSSIDSMMEYYLELWNERNRHGR